MPMTETAETGTNGAPVKLFRISRVKGLGVEAHRFVGEQSPIHARMGGPTPHNEVSGKIACD
jgi:hypothetical protein